MQLMLMVAGRDNYLSSHSGLGSLLPLKDAILFQDTKISKLSNQCVPREEATIDDSLPPSFKLQTV